jgi:hypothetical protein
MATILVEMGATHLVEMGSPGFLENVPASSPVRRIFEFVDYLESPFKGIDIEPGESVSSKQYAIADRLKSLSRMQRKNLVAQASLGGLDGSDLLAESSRLSKSLDGLYADFSQLEAELGKFSVKKVFRSVTRPVAKVAKKIGKVAKSPAFIAVAGLAANFIPVVGPLVSAGIVTAGKMQAEKDAKKKGKRQFRKADRAASAMEANQLNDYYRQNKVTFEYYGYTPDVWAKLSSAQKVVVIDKAVAGTLNHLPPKRTQAEKQQLAEAFAMSQAMKQVYGSQLSGPGIDPKTVPSDVQAMAKPLIPQYVKEINAAGKENFLSTSMKAVGQAGAVSATYSGLGVDLPAGEGVGSVLQTVPNSMPEAFAGGKQDLINSFSTTGSSADGEEAINRGTPSSIPWVPILIAGGTTLGIGVVLLVRSR